MTNLSNVLLDSLHLVDITPNFRVYELTKSELASWMPGALTPDFKLSKYAGGMAGCASTAHCSIVHRKSQYFIIAGLCSNALRIGVDVTHGR